MKRLKEVVSVLTQEGLGFFVDKMKLRWHLPWHKSIQTHHFRTKDHIPMEVRLRRSMEKLGGTYLKLGQLLSLRPDLVPLSYCKEFSKLQDEVKPLPFSQIKKTIENELGTSLNEVFTSFDEKPLGSASVGQVYKARLKNGKEVVVKVQRPEVRTLFREDIDILYYLFSKIDTHYHYENFSPLIILEQFEHYTKRELDYLFEKRNIETFEKQFAKSSFIKIPHVYAHYCTGKLLVMEYMKGVKLSELLSSQKKFPREKIARHLVETALEQVFDTDMFHADLHPGNMLVCSNGKIALLDFGIVGSLDDDLRSRGLDLFMAILDKDVSGVVGAFTKMGEVHEDTNLDALRNDVHDIIMHWHGASLREVRITSMLHQLFDACLKHHISLPVDLILLGKALVTAEGTCMQLDPNFDFIDVAKPYLAFFLQKKIKKSLNPKHVVREALLFKDLIKEIPHETLAVLDTLKRGKLHVDIAKEEVSHLTQEIDRSSNRVSFAVLIAAFILAGSLLAVAGIGSPVLGIPLLAFISFSFAGAVGLFLFVSIVREGKWKG